MKTALTLVMALLFAVTVQAQTGAFASSCPTMEQQQAAYNQQKANGIIVRDTYTQQLQCYYQQLATYWQQKDKDNQQIAKDKQQIAKDLQQVQKEAQLIAWENALKSREASISSYTTEIYNLRLLVNQLILIINQDDDCDCGLSLKIKDHINHSGLFDGTNPGSSTQDNGGILNPSN